uniref:Integrator complex subunit 6-A n=1 Tax=Cacopsylla melanoneura TaxID=428564 RepID=A0A8D9AIE5_9HEMI
MTIIVFLIDTSASMNQRAYLGGRPKLLDIAKGAVETFVKVRQRSPESRGDRYMLLTFEEPPSNIKAGWKENLTTFMTELKNLQCTGMTLLGAALKHTFDVLNMNRMQSGIDTYGQGRSPFFLEPAVIVVITDGGKLSNATGVQDEFNLPMHSPIPGSEMTREPFRWDQRLFSLVLRLAGTPCPDSNMGVVACDNSPIDAMCEVTGGRSYCVTSHRMLLQCIDSLVQKVQSGVVINFEKIGPDPPPLPNENKDPDLEEMDWDKEIINYPSNSLSEVKINSVINGMNNRNKGSSTPLAVGTDPALNNIAWHNCRKLIYVPRSAQKGFPVGFWPIPESFWPDITASSFPARSAHPNVKFTCTSQDPLVIENLPFDKYELEPSPLTQYILARKQPTICWQVFVANSYKNPDVGHPFGYLKASTNLSTVNLFVMPYNYPALLPLLDDFFKVHRMKVTPEWRNNFQKYITTMPCYYAAPLRRALIRMGMPSAVSQSLIPDSMDNSLSYSVLNYLKRMKIQAKNEFDRLCNEVSTKQNSNNKNPIAAESIRVMSRSPLKRDLISNPTLQDKFSSLKEQLSEFGGFVVGVERTRKHHPGSMSYRNPFDIQRRHLLDQVVRMRANFLQPQATQMKLLDEDYLHTMPISQMGNYQEYLKRMAAPLREVESTPVRQHMFGNPFKIDKRMMVDEADIDLVGGGGGSPHKGGGSKRSSSGDVTPRLASKRKPGPIPRHVTVKRQRTSSTSSLESEGSTPPPSPAPSPPPPSLSPCPSPLSSPSSPYPMSNGLPDPVPDEDTGGPLTIAEDPLPPLDHPPPPAPPILLPEPPHPHYLTNNHQDEHVPPPTPLLNHTNGTNHTTHPSPSLLNNHHGGVDSPPSPPSPTPTPNSETLCPAEVKKHNMKVRAMVYKELLFFIVTMDSIQLPRF